METIEPNFEKERSNPGVRGLVHSDPCTMQLRDELTDLQKDVDSLRRTVIEQDGTCIDLSVGLAHIRAEMVHAGVLAPTSTYSKCTEQHGSIGRGGSNVDIVKRSAPQVNEPGKRIRDLVKDQVNMEVAAAFGRARTAQEKNRLELEGKLDELNGHLRASDRCHTVKIEKLQAWQEEVDRRIQGMDPSIRQAGQACLAELRTVRAEIERQLEALGTRLDDEKDRVQSLMQCQAKELGEKQKLCSVELHRLLRNSDQKFESWRKGADRLSLDMQGLQTELGKQLEEHTVRIQGLGQASAAHRDALPLKASREDVSKELADLAASIQRQIVESQSTLYSHLEEKAKEHSKELAKQTVEVLGRIRDTDKLVEASKVCADDAVKASESRLEAALRMSVGDLGQRLDADVATLALRIDEEAARAEVAKLKAEEACRGLASTSSRQLELLRADVVEQVSTLRADSDRGLTALHGALATTRDALERAFFKEAGSLRRDIVQQGADFSRELTTVQDALASQVGSLSKRATLIEGRLELEASRSAEEFAGAVRAEHDRAGILRQSLEAEFKHVLLQAEKRLHERVEEAADRVVTLEDRVRELHTDAACSHTTQMQRQDEIEATAELARNARDEALQASSVAKVTAESLAAAVTAAQLEVSANHQSLGEMRSGADALAAGLIKVAQCCGVLGGFEDEGESYGDDAHSVPQQAESVGLAKVLEWDKSGTPLAARVEQCWLSRLGCSNRCRTLLGLIARKADTTELRHLQVSLRDVDAKAMFILGEPIAGAFGVAAHASRKTSAATTSAADVASAPAAPAQQVAAGWLPAPAPAYDHRLRHLFELCDTRGDNRLDKEELVNRCMSSKFAADLLGLRAQSSRDAAVWWLQDLGTAGSASWLEFQDWMAKKHREDAPQLHLHASTAPDAGPSRKMTSPAAALSPDSGTSSTCLGVDSQDALCCSLSVASSTHGSRSERSFNSPQPQPPLRNSSGSAFGGRRLAPRSR